jgi:small subunit ribosomal protein S8
MSMTDPIADMLTRIRNAGIARHEKVDIPASKLKSSIAQILLDEGYVKSYKLLEDDKQGTIRIFLKYGPDKKSIISGLRRVSRPGCRRYVTKDELPRIRGGYGSAVISTSRGLLTSVQCRREQVGGEVLCYVW